MERKRKQESNDVEPSVTSDEIDAENDGDQRRKRLKMNDMKRVCVICGSDRKTVKQQKIHRLLRICEKQIVQKLLNAAKLFHDLYILKQQRCVVQKMFSQQISTITATVVKNTSTNTTRKILEIMKSLEAEESVAVGNEFLKERFLALGLDFQSTAYSLSFIREKLNKIQLLALQLPTELSSKLIIELCGGDVCFTYPRNQRISQMVFSTGRDPQSLVEAMRVSSVQQVATTLARQSQIQKDSRREFFPLRKFHT